MIQPPKIDGRDGRDVVAQLRTLLPRYTPDWSRDANEKQLAEAMVHVFARFSEIVIDRINRAPGKNFLAFLQLLGVSNLRPRAAQVPLTFYLAGEGADFAVVREGTQVAAQLLKGEKDPVLFETDRELVVVSTRLTALFFKDGERDLYSDFSRVLPQAPPAAGAVMAQAIEELPLLQGNMPLPHSLYIGLNVFSPSSTIDRLSLKLVLQERPTSAIGQAAVAWELCIPAAAKPPRTRNADAVQETMQLEDLVAAGTLLKPSTDSTAGLTKSGEVTFDNVPPSPLRSPQGDQQYWVVCKLLTPIVSAAPSNDAGLADGVLRADDLPTIASISGAIEVDRADLQISHAFFNNLKLDLSKDFYPFGDRPKFGDTLYLGSTELFSSRDMAIVLHLEMTNPAGVQGESPVLPTGPQRVRLEWEFWDGSCWSHLGASEDDDAIRILDPHGAPAQLRPFRDGTNAFSTDGDVSFRFPNAPASTHVNGTASFWIRVRIASGNYGQDSHRERELIGSTPIPANFAPPMIHSIRADYQIRSILPVPTVIAYNDFFYRTIQTSKSEDSAGQAFQPFESAVAEDAKPAIYFGFEQPASKALNSAAPGLPSASGFPPRSMCIYLDVEQTSRGLAEGPDSNSQAITWQYWNGSGWVRWTVRDETGGFRHPGLVRFLAPSDFAASSRFGQLRYWLRAMPPSTNYQPKIRMVLLNTVMATGWTTIRNELLGVSNGMPEQSFRLLHSPVLQGQRLEVLEPRMPGRMEQEAIRSHEGEDAIQVVSEVPGQTAVWVRWHEVADFYASGPRDRHYLLDPLSGAVTFGDGSNGQIPSPRAKIRACTYRSGGGAVGNRPAWNITQTKTAVPYIGKVCNWIAAGGGGDAEDNESLLERGSRGIRHGGRAVTVQDYEDVARLASPEVARAKCVPLFDLAAEPVGKHRCPGVVSVIVVPRSNNPRPSPGSQLLQYVLDYLQCSSSPAAQIVVVAPSYIRIDITAEIVVKDQDGIAEVELAVKLALTSFLHPLSGGPGGSGWSFGRMPHRSDLYVLIERVPGVEYVRNVSIFSIADYADLERTDYFLVCPGEVEVVPSLDLAVREGAQCR